MARYQVRGSLIIAVTVFSLAFSCFGLWHLKKENRLEDDWWFAVLPIALNTLLILLILPILRFDQAAQKMVAFISLVISIFGICTHDKSVFKEKNGADNEWWFTVFQIIINFIKFSFSMGVDANEEFTEQQYNNFRVSLNMFNFISLCLNIYGYGTLDLNTFKELTRADNEWWFTVLQIIVDSIHTFILIF